jgi:hypothetical protein
MKNVLDNPDEKWNWHYLSANPGIKMEDVLKNKDIEWDWDLLTENPGIKMKDVLDNPEKEWDFAVLGLNEFGYKESAIVYYAKRRDATMEQTKVFGDELMATVYHPRWEAGP